MISVVFIHDPQQTAIALDLQPYQSSSPKLTFHHFPISLSPDFCRRAANNKYPHDLCSLQQAVSITTSQITPFHLF
jgi:hypothetical protein